MKYFKTTLSAFAFAVCMGIALPAQAAALTETQIQAILSLLSSFGADASVVTNVDASLRGKAVSAVASNPASTPADRCLFVKTLTRTLYEGLSDSETSGEVTALQKFLAADPALYPEGRVTGYFGPATERAVERWQAANGVVSSGTAETNGFGVVGFKTRSALAQKCGYAAPAAPSVAPKQTEPASAVTNTAKPSTIGADQIKVTAPQSTTVNVGTKITVTYVVGSGITAGDPAIVERAIVNTATEMVVSGYIPLSQSAGTYSFDWIPNEPGTYQALLKINLNNQQYPARSGVITVLGNPTSNVSALVPTLSVSASPPTIPAGQGTTLVWNSTSANRCVLKYGAGEETVPTSGGKTVTPSQTTTYLIWCVNDPGNGKDGPAASANVTVYVTTTYH